MEGSQTAASEHKVLTALDTAWQKFGAFANEAMVELKFADVQVTEAREILSHDVILFLPKIRSFINKHAEALHSKDVAYFQNLCPPSLAELRTMEIPERISDKAFLFARVFESLLNDLARAQ